MEFAISDRNIWRAIIWWYIQYIAQHLIKGLIATILIQTTMSQPDMVGQTIFIGKGETTTTSFMSAMVSRSVNTDHDRAAFSKGGVGADALHARPFDVWSKGVMWGPHLVIT